MTITRILHAAYNSVMPGKRIDRPQRICFTISRECARQVAAIGKDMAREQGRRLTVTRGEIIERAVGSLYDRIVRRQMSAPVTSPAGRSAQARADISRECVQQIEQLRVALADDPHRPTGPGRREQPSRSEVIERAIAVAYAVKKKS